MKAFFTPKEVAKLINISYRQIQYWDKSNFIRPSYRRRGKYRLYTFPDLIRLKIARLLRDNSYSVQRLRKTIRDLKELLSKVRDPAQMNFLIDGDRVLAFQGEVQITGKSLSSIYFSAKTLRAEVESVYPGIQAVA